MRIFFDSSAYAKRFVEEKGSDVVEEICRNATSLALSIICVPEIISALNRRLREKNIESSDYHLAKTRLMEDIGDITIVNITAGVIIKSIDLLENNALKAMDAMHIACALEWNPDLFVSCDSRQAEAAQRAGLQMRFINGS
jgi:predicted nucleic acid-binding protein